MFERILIANRGEIALRIIRACRELGIRTVAVYSKADEESMHVQMADEAICIGPATASDSYLKIANIISAAEVADVDAIHPGYGFLAENAHFAEILGEVGLTWIGPSPQAIRSMGDKAVAKATVGRAGVPTIPGSPGPLSSVEDALTIAGRIGYPVLLKAVAGGGGRGMRLARNDKELAAAFDLATHEAERAFGNGSLYLERYLAEPRHIEIQVFGDMHGRVVHLGERECSLQRRHQKILEESPSVAVTPVLREKMGEAAVRAARAVDYVGAGTIEFLLDEDGSYYFMEMNTRIQVEHPVTEMVTGFDLVKEQIRVAAGQPLSFGEAHVGSGFSARGHAIEFRINAEDPETFAPSPGTITTLHLPGGPGVRVDTAAYAGWKIPPHYDSLIAKLVVHGRDREEALMRGKRALELFIVEGVQTTIPLHRRLLDEPDVRSGSFSTKWLERWLATEKGG